MSLRASPIRGPHLRTRLCIAFSLPAVLLVACSEKGVSPTASDEGARPAVAAAPACATRANNTVERLLECVTLSGVQSHLAALQAIADANNGTRVSGSPGFDQSVAYVVNTLQGAGYAVTVQPFEYETFFSRAPAVLEQVTPSAGAIAASEMSYSGSGDVTSAATIVPQLGCNPADFAGFPAGNIAVISRGTCTFASKATNAYNAGAAAVVIYNDRAGSINGTLLVTFTIDIPVLQISQAAGVELVNTPGLVLRAKTETFRGTATSYNVLAETADGDPNNVVMVGAHLDAVSAGPGIQDNASGSAAILETALQISRVRPRNKVRFAWWGAEESGLVGSTHYVANLAAGDLNRIALYLNFDMIASPNYGFFVYDGDDSDGVGAGPGPAGSAAIETLFESFYLARALPSRGTDLNGRSDYGPFIAAGIPSGGLFTGADGNKTAEQAALWGGTASIAFDPCYHQACDTFANLNTFALDVNVDAVAFATLSLSMNTSQVNGGKAKGNFKTNGIGPRNSSHEQARQ